MGKLSEENIRTIGKIIISLLIIILIGLIVALWNYSDDDDDDSSGSGSSGSGTSSGDCIPPDPVTTGYDISNVTGSPSKAGFSITGVTCATGYTGTATASACSVVGQAYTLTGCSLIDSVGSGGDGGSINNCDENEPVLTDSNMNAITADSCDGTAIGGTCGHTCSSGYTGGSVTCLPDGTWAVMPCNQTVTDPAPATGPAAAPRTCVGFDCRGSPNSLNDSPADVPCQADPCTAQECCTVEPAPAPAPATEPATEPRCIRPTETSITDVYDFSSAQETLTINGFEVTGITCKTGYGPDADGITATICDGDGQPYNVTGCSDTDGCAGVDCGTGATCTDNPAPQTGYTCSCGPGYAGEPPNAPCVEIDGCAGVDCGTGATCTDNPAPQTGYTCSCGPGDSWSQGGGGVGNCTPQLNDPFYLADTEQSCTDFCNSLESARTCSNNDINQETFFDEGGPGNIFFTNTCNNNVMEQSRRSLQSLGPYYDQRLEFCYRSSGAPSNCDSVYPNARRICKCTRQ